MHAKQSRKRKHLNQQTQGAAGRKKKKSIASAVVPYHKDEPILLVGEGNFSFGSALTQLLGTSSNITATTLDSIELVQTKYDDAKKHMKIITDAGGQVLCGIDGTKLDKYRQKFQFLYFDKIVFNFPHTGGKADALQTVKENQKLLKHFLSSAVTLLRAKGQIHVTVKLGHPYTLWNIVGLLSEKELIDRIRFVNALPFFPHLYPGYEHRRTMGYEEYVSTDQNFDIIQGAKTYIFTYHPNSPPPIESTCYINPLIPRFAMQQQHRQEEQHHRQHNKQNEQEEQEEQEEEQEDAKEGEEREEKEGEEREGEEKKEEKKEEKEEEGEEGEEGEGEEKGEEKGEEEEEKGEEEEEGEGGEEGEEGEEKGEEEEKEEMRQQLTTNNAKKKKQHDNNILFTSSLHPPTNNYQRNKHEKTIPPVNRL